MLIFAHPWGLLALAGVPALIGIYLYRQRFRPKPVAGLFLWPAGDRLPPAGRTRSRLETPLSLLLECLAVLALAGLVSGAQWERAVTSPHCIAILDDSACMGARAPTGERAADRALAAVERACRDLGPLGSVRLTLIRSGPRPVVAVGPAAWADRGLDEFRRAGWTPLLPRHSFGPALTVAQRLADAGGTILLATDHPDRAAEDIGAPSTLLRAGPSASLGAGAVRILAVGAPLPNVGIVLAERAPVESEVLHPRSKVGQSGARGSGLPPATAGTSGPDLSAEALAKAEGPSHGTSIVHVRIANYSPEPATRTVTLAGADGAKPAEEALRLGAGEDAALSWSIGPGHPQVTVRLQGSDALAGDDQAVLLEPRPRFARVRCDFPAGSPERERVEKACKAVPHIAWLDAADAQAPDIVVGPPVAPAAADDASGPWRFMIGPPPPSLRGGDAAGPLLGPYVADDAHPLARQLDVRGVVWTGAGPLRPDAPVTPILTTGDLPLLFQWREWKAPAFVLALDAGTSNFHKSPAWPLLFHNLASMRRDAMPGLRRWNVRQGETVAWRLAPGTPAKAAQEVMMLDPAQRELPVARLRDRVETTETWAPGVYSVLGADAAGALDRFAVNLLDPQTSDLRGASDAAPLPPPSAAAAGPSLLTQRAPWPWLAPGLCLGALALVLGDLWTTQRSGRP